METRRVAIVALAAAFLPGCAGSYYDSYRAEHPGWYSSLPEPGLGLYEVLASLQAPGSGRARVWASQLEVVRLAGGDATELGPDAIAARLQGSGDDLAVVVARTCLSEVDVRRYRAEKVSWLLLEGGRLSAWDFHDFGERCVVSNDLRPASAGGASLEARVRAFRDAAFPSSMSHAAELYQQGLVYWAAGRTDTAREMLERGDRSFDVSDGQGIRFGRPSASVDVATASDAARLRARLAAALAQDPGIHEPSP